jgi:predicted site-specific integrase-resolvase
MEEALEQERMKLEEVVKMEIKARISTSDQLKELIGSQISKVTSEIGGLESKLTETASGLKKDVDQV